MRVKVTVTYKKENGKTCPTEILELLDNFNVEGRPLWKPMHMQPFYEGNEYFSADDKSLAEDIFARGLCLPSDINMTTEQQDIIIDLIKSCFA